MIFLWISKQQNVKILLKNVWNSFFQTEGFQDLKAMLTFIEQIVVGSLSVLNICDINL